MKKLFCFIAMLPCLSLILGCNPFPNVPGGPNLTACNDAPSVCVQLFLDNTQYVAP